MPIVEPEVLMDGDHTIERCFEVTVGGARRALRGAVRRSGSRLDGTLLKPNMVLSGSTRVAAGVGQEVAEATVRCFRATVPAAVPGIVFLSGGQTDELATAHLNAMNQLGDLPVAAELLLRPGAAGAGAQGVEGRDRQRRRRAQRVPPPGQAQQRRPFRLVHDRHGESRQLTRLKLSSDVLG